MSIIMFFINLFMMLTMVIVMYYEGTICSKPNGNVILGTTLPHEKIKCNEVLEIVNEYKKANKIYTLITAITYIPCFFLERRISLWLYYMLAWCFIIIYAQGLVYKKYFSKLQKLKRENNWYLLNGNEVLADDDMYYGPFFYNNPNDSRIMVDKRIGIGQTLNIGNKKGKAIWIGTIIFIMACLIPALIITAKLDNPNFYLVVNNDKVTIESPMYGIEFNTSEIEDVKLVQYKDIKGARKTNGAATSEIALGNFTFNDYGKTKTYVYKQVEDIIVIKLKDKYVFINGNTTEKTEEYYNKLVKYTK